MKDYMKIYNEWLANPYFDEATKEELRGWLEKSGLPVKRFFNTSGMKYKELKLRDRIPLMSEEEQIELLATDGMLVKRPILVTDKGVCPGFKEDVWQTLI